jgi:hypothetical protein
MQAPPPAATGNDAATGLRAAMRYVSKRPESSLTEDYRAKLEKALRATEKEVKQATQQSAIADFFKPAAQLIHCPKRA